MRAVAVRRGKGCGRVFARGGVWYLRYRANGIERTRSTRIGVDALTPHRLEASRRKALAVLNEETEVLRLKDRESGLRIVRSMLEDTRERLRDSMEEVRRNAPLAALQGLFDASARRPDLSARQAETYSRYIRELVAGVGAEVKIRDVTDGVADAFARRLAEGAISPNTYNKHLNGYALIWDTVMGVVGIASNPWRTIPHKRLDTSVRRALTDDECERLLAAAVGEMRTLLAIGLYTGLRLGDAVHLRRSDIRDGAVFVERTRKTGAGVGIPLHPRLKSILDAQGGGTDAFTPSLAKVYDKQGNSCVVRLVRRVFAKCGIETSASVGANDGRRARPLCGFHSLRSTFVTRCIAAGVPQAVVQTLVGHASQRMTQHYTHLQNRDILAAFAAVR